MNPSALERLIASIGIELIPNWKGMLRMYSVWIFGLLAAIPELYDQAVSMGLIEGSDLPAFINRAIAFVAFMGVASRVVKQKSLEIKEQIPQEDDKAS